MTALTEKDSFLYTANIQKEFKFGTLGKLKAIAQQGMFLKNITPLKQVFLYKHQEFQTSGTRAMHCEIITKEK
jgi:hypothetical protein